MTELHHDELKDPKKRDMLVLASQAMGALGAGALLWPFVDSMNPAADVLALASTEVNLESVKPGQEIRVMWRGKPVFIRHRTEEEIKEARAVTVDTLPDPQEDKERVKEGKEQWIVMLGVCTHLGCVPLGNNAGEFNGWFCPCHGSHYDTSGRIRKGPAPANLAIPDYSFTDDTHIKIG
ncbi:MAG: ubiquinol-cytochrome c reductase iron-sulfur subunit [Alphaproteobacteria bacterium]|nr:MAG: ubiquinol-cytochrome c reductase iron-sulfur subunit [Alphaproteobacteria bacterium]